MLRYYNGKYLVYDWVKKQWLDNVTRKVVKVPEETNISEMEED